MGELGKGCVVNKGGGSFHVLPPFHPSQTIHTDQTYPHLRPKRSHSHRHAQRSNRKRRGGRKCSAYGCVCVYVCAGEGKIHVEEDNKKQKEPRLESSKTGSEISLSFLERGKEEGREHSLSRLSFPFLFPPVFLFVCALIWFFCVRPPVASQEERMLEECCLRPHASRVGGLIKDVIAHSHRHTHTYTYYICRENNQIQSRHHETGTTHTQNIHHMYPQGLTETSAAAVALLLLLLLLLQVLLLLLLPLNNES